MTGMPPAEAPFPLRALDDQLRTVRAKSLALIEGLSGEDCAVQSMPDASPVKWHLAHTTWFFEVFVLEAFERRFKPFDPAFRVLFNSYYNGVGDKHPRPERGLLTRPGLDTVLAYRNAVETRVFDLLASPRLDPAVSALVTLGLHHEQQHQELLLTDLKHLLSRNPLAPSYRKRWKPVPVTSAPDAWIGYQGGLREIGFTGDGFSFDNESPRHAAFVQPFELFARPVSYGDVIDFVADGGYQRPELWLSLGWDTVRRQNWRAPLYWEHRDDRWWTFTLYGMAEISRDVPAAHLSYFESDAIARWRGARLPTEAEWELAASREPIQGNFLDSDALHPLACTERPAAGQPAQLYGDVWEWTQSAYLPYPGYRAARGAVGEYNGKFMCNQFVLRGGSCASPQSHLRPTYRNFFPPDAQWQFSGARLARDLD